MKLCTLCTCLFAKAFLVIIVICKLQLQLWPNLKIYVSSHVIKQSKSVLWWRTLLHFHHIALLWFFPFWLNHVFHLFSLHTRWNTWFGQNPKNQKIALKSTKIIGYFFLEPFWKIWGISDILKWFWGQKIFPSFPKSHIT